MLAVDTNILVYAHRGDLPFHAASKALLEHLVSANEPWGIPWPCVHEFLATVTHPRRFKPPTPMAQAFDQASAWREAGAEFLGEGHDHLARLTAVVTAGRISGPVVHDARIATICLSHGVRELLTFDRDFSRFPSLKVRNPLV